MKRVAGEFLALIGIAVLAMARLLVFGTAEPPPPMKSIDSALGCVPFSERMA
jgi:hypothetical protein